MPLPDDQLLDVEIGKLFDAVMTRAAEPGQFGIVSAYGARLQAASQRRLVVATERATEAQNRSAAAQEQANMRMERLERVGIGLGALAVLLTMAQIALAMFAAAD